MRLLFRSLLVILFALPLLANAADIEARFVDEKGNPVVEAVISAIPLGAQAVPAVSEKPVELEQIGKAFKPHVTIVQKGGKVAFPNRDSISHHVYSFSETKKFELPLYSGASAPIKFDKAGVVTLGCNIHDWMKAYIVVVDTPFFALSDAAGRAFIKDLPAGAWRLEVWHPRQKTDVKPREVNLSEVSLTESFTMGLRREWKKQQGGAGDGMGY